ncbi:MAG: type IV pilus modification protein PilV [Methylomonas sp.]
MKKWSFPFIRQSVFTLLEVFVTMAIVGVGLLGQAAIMAQSAKSVNAAFYRSVASFLADDYLERMRMNTGLAIPASSSATGSFNIAAGNAPAVNLTAGGIAYYEVNDWLNNVTTMLPNGQAVVTVDASRNVTMTISWTELAKGPDALNNAQATTFTTKSVL